MLKLCLFIVMFLSFGAHAQESQNGVSENSILILDEDAQALESIPSEELGNDSLLGLTLFAGPAVGPHLPAFLFIASVSGGIGLRVGPTEIGIEGDTGEFLAGGSSYGTYALVRPVPVGEWKRVYIKGRLFRVVNLEDANWTFFEDGQGSFDAFEIGVGADLGDVRSWGSRVELTIGDTIGEDVITDSGKVYRPFRIAFSITHSNE